MFKQRLAIFALLLAIVFGSGLVIGILFPRWAGVGSKPKVHNTATILKQVQTLSQLVTVKYVMERVEELEAAPTSTLGQWLTGHRCERSEEHTSELQSLRHLVCRLLL